MDQPDFFIGPGGKYPGDSRRAGYTSLPVLQFLLGQPWDEMALACCLAFRPTKIRVTTGGVHCDAMTNRITVYIDKLDTKLIRYIAMELQVELPDGIQHGHDFNCALRKRGVDIDPHW